VQIGGALAPPVSRSPSHLGPNESGFPVSICRLPPSGRRPGRGYHLPMPRSEKTARRLVVDGETFLWSLHHVHDAVGNGGFHGCREILVIRRFTARGRLHIVFRSGPDRLVPDGYVMPSGAVGTANGPLLNLHEPGTVRAFLDEALANGWQPDDPPTQEMDGWRLFDSVAARRGEERPE
jgi:hypothetical protein